MYTFIFCKIVYTCIYITLPHAYIQYGSLDGVWNSSIGHAHLHFVNLSIGQGHSNDALDNQE